MAMAAAACRRKWAPPSVSNSTLEKRKKAYEEQTKFWADVVCPFFRFFHVRYLMKLDRMPSYIM